MYVHVNQTACNIYGYMGTKLIICALSSVVINNVDW